MTVYKETGGSNYFRYEGRLDMMLTVQVEGESFREFLVRCWGKLNFYIIKFGSLYDGDDNLVGEIDYRKKEFRDMRRKKFKSFSIKIKEGLINENQEV